MRYRLDRSRAQKPWPVHEQLLPKHIFPSQSCNYCSCRCRQLREGRCWLEASITSGPSLGSNSIHTSLHSPSGPLWGSQNMQHPYNGWKQSCTTRHTLQELQGGEGPKWGKIFCTIAAVTCSTRSSRPALPPRRRPK